MIATPITKMEAAVEAALAEQCAQLAGSAPGCWSFPLSDGARGSVQARLEDGWLCLRLPLPDQGLMLWDALALNAEMRALGKIVLAPGGSSLEAAAEIPVAAAPDGALAQRLREALADIAVAQGGALGRAGASSPAVPESGQATQVPPCELLRESGWPVTIRPSGVAAVRLDVPGEFCQALVEADERAAVLRLKSDLGEVAGVSAATREATALLLLATSAAVRLARAFADGGSQGAPIGFEATFPTPVTSTEVGHALGALSVAARMCRREFGVVRDESVASAYLAVHGRGC